MSLRLNCVESMREVSVSTEVRLEMFTKTLMDRPRITNRPMIVQKPEVADRYCCLFL